MFRRGAALVDRILQGTLPSAIPVEVANSYELVLNVKPARAIKVEFSRALMLQATRIVE
jgi:ABC-type uncharacterized transport system substrate-binding protein